MVPEEAPPRRRHTNVLRVLHIVEPDLNQSSRSIKTQIPGRRRGAGVSLMEAGTGPTGGPCVRVYRPQSSGLCTLECGRTCHTGPPQQRFRKSLTPLGSSGAVRPLPWSLWTPCPVRTAGMTLEYQRHYS